VSVSAVGVAVPIVTVAAVVVSAMVIAIAAVIGSIIGVPIIYWRSDGDGRSAIWSSIAVSISRAPINRRGGWHTDSDSGYRWQRQRETHAHVHPTGL